MGWGSPLVDLWWQPPHHGLSAKKLEKPAVQVLFAFAPFVTCILLGIHIYQVALEPDESHDHH